MNDRTRTTLYAILFMGGIATVAVIITVGMLYDAALNQTRNQLTDTVTSQAHLIGAVTRFDRSQNMNGDLEAAFNITLSQIVEAHERDKGFGETGEFTLAKMENNTIVFLLSHRHEEEFGTHSHHEPVPMSGTYAEPMRRALQGRSGTMVGQDYRGETVIAAYKPISELRCGIVAKIDLAEVRRPLIKAGGVALLVVVLMTCGGTLFILKPLLFRLEESTARITSIIKTAVDPIVTFTGNGSINSFNPAAERLFGYTAEEVLGRNINILMPSPFHEKHDGYLARYMMTGKKNIIGMGRDVIGKKRDGTTFPMHLSVSEVEFQTKEGTQSERLFTGFVRDLTKQKQREEDLLQATREAENLIAFGDIIDQSLNEIFIFDAASLKFIHANYGARRNIGYTLEELQEMTPVDLKPEITQASFAELIYPLLDGTKESIECTTIHRRKDGTEYPVEVHFATSTLGERPVIVAVILDLTEQVKSEERLQKLSAAVEQSPMSIVITDNKGNIEYVNARFTQATGYTSEEMIGKNPRLLNSGETPAETFTQMWDAIGKGDVWQGEFHNRKKNGELYWELATLAPIRNAKGEMTHFVALKENITQKKLLESNLVQAKHEAEAANRAKSEFLANMSHEIRTPMTAILGYTDLLLSEGDLSKAPKDRVEAVEIIKRNGHFLLDLINNILDLSKIEAGKIDAERIDSDPHDIISDVYCLMKVRAEAKGIELNMNFDGPIPTTIQSDPTRLRQILINVIDNAIKFTSKGAVEVSVRLLNESGQNSQLQFDITDTGIGIAQENLEKLFTPFTQADGSTTRQFGGTGLGLTISKCLTEILGGDLTVTSTLGKGSTFTLTVETGSLENVQLIHGDIKQDNAQVVAKAVEANSEKMEAPLHNCRILFVEDGLDNQRLISFVLKKAGAKVTLAENGQISYDLASSTLADGNPYDVILTDMQMPVMDGYESTRKLRDDGYAGPIIALTAHAMESDRQLCLDAGCDDYTTKPINRKELIAMVAKYARMAQAEVEA